MRLMLIFGFLFFVTDAMAVCTSPVERDNFSANTVLTSTKLNLDFNTAYTRLNELPGDCITDETITSAKIDDGTIVNADISTTADIARSKLGTINYQVSTDSGAFSTSSTTLVDATNLSVTITTTGKPVEISLIAKASATTDFSNTGYILARGTESTAESSTIAILRAGTVIASEMFFADSSLADTFENGYPCGSLRFIDFPAAGVHTYKIQAMATHYISISNCRLLAREL